AAEPGERADQHPGRRRRPVQLDELFRTRSTDPARRYRGHRGISTADDGATAVPARCAAGLGSRGRYPYDRVRRHHHLDQDLAARFRTVTQRPDDADPGVAAIMAAMTFLAVPEAPASDRPRERLYRLGAAALTHAELLAILVNTGRAGRSSL